MGPQVFEGHYRGRSLFQGASLLQVYVNTNLASDVDSRKSTMGYVYTLGDTAVSWVSQLQKIVALSTIGVVYVAITEASKEMIWLRS